jgi:uncharacterized sodium:solute symporter family permease YidK
LAERILWLALGVAGIVVALFGLLYVLAIWSSDTADSELLEVGIPLVVGGGLVGVYSLIRASARGGP